MIPEITKFLINPLLYVFLILIIMVLSKRHKKKLISFLIVYMYIISIPLTSQMFYDKWQVPDTFRSNIKYDAVVVLAGVSSLGEYIDGSGRPEMKEDYLRAGFGINRIIAGIHFIRNGYGKILLFGNWEINSVSEAAMVKKYALLCGIKEGQFQVYGDVNRTLDEAKGVKLYAERNNCKSILLVTSEYHMRRAVALFKKQGLAVDNFSVDREYMKIDWKGFIPTPAGIKETFNCLYELFGYIGYYLKGDI